MTALPFLHPLRLFRRTAVTPPFSAIVCALALVTAPASAQAPFPPDSKVQVLLQQLVNSHGIRGIVVGLLNENGTRRVISHAHPERSTCAYAECRGSFARRSWNKTRPGLMPATIATGCLR